MAPKIDRNVFRDLSYGLYIVASRHEGRSNAQVVNTVIQVTSDPPLKDTSSDGSSFSAIFYDPGNIRAKFFV